MKTLLTIALLLCCDGICKTATPQEIGMLEFELNNGICIEQEVR